MSYTFRFTALAVALGLVAGACSENTTPTVASDTGIEAVLTPAHFADWLLATGIEPDLALRRAPYLPAGTVEARLEEMARKGLTEPGPEGAVATQTLRLALEAMQRENA